MNLIKICRSLKDSQNNGTSNSSNPYKQEHSLQSLSQW